MIWKLLLLQTCFFGLLVFVLQKFFHGNLVQAINRIEVLRQKTRIQEEGLKRERLFFSRQCEERLRAEEIKIDEMRKNADLEIKQIRELNLKQLESDKESLRLGYEQQAENLKIRLHEESELQVSRMACDLIRSAFTAEMAQALHKELCLELLEAMSQILPKKIKLDGRPRISTAFTLTSEEKKNIQAQLQAVLPTGPSAEGIEIDESLDSLLVAGFILYLGDHVIDGSLKNHLEKELSRHGKKSAV